MNDNIDDWLNSLGLDSPTVPAVQPVEESQQPQESALSDPTQSISPEDFNDILAENGFQEPQYEEAENVTDESEETEEEESSGYVGNGILAQIQAIQDVNEDYPEHNPDEEVFQDSMALLDEVSRTQDSPERELLIPPNSPTLTINSATSRFSGTEWYNEIQKARAILAGCGGIGSWTALLLARMNLATLCLYDDDTVEQANMSGQFYGMLDIGRFKVDVMADAILDYTTTSNVFAINTRFTEQSKAGDIMICGFDNMAARRTFFNAWRNHVYTKPAEDRTKCLYLDGRLSIDTLQVFCITGDDEYSMKVYDHDYLFTDAQAEETQCSLKQTSYLACMIASVIVNLFTNWTANNLNPVIPYDLPFFTEYDAQNMIFKTIK